LWAGSGLAVILHNLTGAGWPAVVISAGALASIFSVLLATLYGQTRILYAMSRDGLLPKLFQKVDEVRRVPMSQHLGRVAGRGASWRRWCRCEVLVNLTSMGTLIAFAAVSLGVIMLRRWAAGSAAWLPGAAVPGASPVAKVFCYLIAGLPRKHVPAFAAVDRGGLQHLFRAFLPKSALIEGRAAPSKHVGPGREADAGDPISGHWRLCR
jgi:APA family basic amino acid/polyamine antiporter